MISHIFVIEQTEKIKISHFVRYFLVNGSATVDYFDSDDMSKATAFLKNAKERYNDMRVYIIASDNLHFAYELPEMENDEDIIAAARLRLKKDLLFPVSQFLFSFSAEVTQKKRTNVQICGIQSSVIGHFRKAFAVAGLDIHRIYLRDQLILDTLSCTGKGAESSDHSFIIKDDGLLFLSNDKSKQQMLRFSARKKILGQGASEELTDSDISRLSKAMIRALNRVGASGDMAIDDGLLDSFGSLPDVALKPLSSFSYDKAYDFLCQSPSKISSKVPFASVTSEENLGFKPTKAHGAGLLVVLWLLFTTYSLWSEEGQLTTVEEGLKAASARIEQAERTRKKCEKQLANLDYAKEAFALFDSETYNTFALLQTLSDCRKGTVKIRALNPSEGSVELHCVAANEKEAFKFVSSLKKASIIDKALLKGINFTKDRKVNFTVELIRNG